MNARQLEVFRAIMRTGTVTDAARLLNVSQPTVSKILRHAETQHGLKLFHTVRGRLAPTPEAELLFPHADRVFRDLGTLNKLVDDLRTGQGGTVRVAASSSLATTVLSRAIATFRRKHPTVHVVSHIIPALETAEKIRSHQADLGLTLSPVVTATLEVIELGRIDMVAIVPEGSPLAERSELRPRDLQSEPLVTFGSDSHFGELLDEAFEREGVTRRVDLQVFSSISAVALVAQGAGVAIIDRLGAASRVPGVVCRPFCPEIKVPINLILSDTQPYAMLCAELIDDIRAAVQASLAEAVT